MSNVTNAKLVDRKALRLPGQLARDASFRHPPRSASPFETHFNPERRPRASSGIDRPPPPDYLASAIPRRRRPPAVPRPAIPRPSTCQGRKPNPSAPRCACLNSWWMESVRPPWVNPPSPNCRSARPHRSREIALTFLAKFWVNLPQPSPARPQGTYLGPSPTTRNAQCPQPLHSHCLASLQTRPRAPLAKRLQRESSRASPIQQRSILAALQWLSREHRTPRPLTGAP